MGDHERVRPVVEVADDREPVGAESDRRAREVLGRIERRGRRRRAREIRAVGDLERLETLDGLVADDAEAVRADRERRVAAHAA